jgi:hypothetical protein
VAHSAPDVPRVRVDARCSVKSSGWKDFTFRIDIKGPGRITFHEEDFTTGDFRLSGDYVQCDHHFTCDERNAREVDSPHDAPNVVPDVLPISPHTMRGEDTPNTPSTPPPLTPKERVEVYRETMKKIQDVMKPFAPSAPAAPTIQFRELPREVQDHVNKVRQSCKDLDPEFKPYDLMQGITAIDLGGDNSRDIMVDNEKLCNNWMKGENCSNRGCDLKIWKQIGSRSWQKVFDEHLYQKYVSVSEKRHFRFMVVSIYAGDSKCRPEPGAFYTSGQSCDLLVSYRNGRWLWEPVGTSRPAESTA